MVKSYKKKVKVGGEGEGGNGTQLQTYTAYSFHAPTISSDGKEISHNPSQTIDWRGTNYNNRTRTAAQKRYTKEYEKYKNKQLNMLRLKPNEPEYVGNSSNNENNNPVINLSPEATMSHSTAIANAEQYQKLRNMEQTPAAIRYKVFNPYSKSNINNLMKTEKGINQLMQTSQGKAALLKTKKGRQLLQLAFEKASKNDATQRRTDEITSLLKQNPNYGENITEKILKHNKQLKNIVAQTAGNRNTKKLSTKKRNTKNRNTKKRK
jgi:hypothetical protein